MQSGEYTFVLLKPDCLERQLAGTVLRRFELAGCAFVDLELIARPVPATAHKHYQEHLGRPYYEAAVAALLEGPLIAAVLYGGPDGLQRARRLAGPAVDPPPGTIRGDLRQDQTRNTVHTSATADDAEREIRLWFGDDRLRAIVQSADRTPPLRQGDILDELDIGRDI